MDSLDDLETVLQQLLVAPKVKSSALATVSQDQGVYVLWAAGDRPVCLKVGIAGPRQGKGLRERLHLHYLSNLSNSVLARHLVADSTSPWSAGFDFNVQQQRQTFLSKNCYFQALAVPGISRSELLRLETFLVEKLLPVYIGRVKKRVATGTAKLRSAPPAAMEQA